MHENKKSTKNRRNGTLINGVNGNIRETRIVKNIEHLNEQDRDTTEMEN